MAITKILARKGRLDIGINYIVTQGDVAALQARTEETLANLMKQRTILNVRKKKRRKLYTALADVAVLAPAKALYEDGLSEMEAEYARYMEAVAVLDQCAIPREQLSNEKAEIYEQVVEINRQIRAERKKLALTMALASNRKVLSGKVNMGKMLRETRDLRRFPMTPEQYKQFKKLAKKHKLLFSVIKDKDDKGKLIDVILPVTELERANAIFERILYTLPPERKPAKPLQQGHEVFQRSRQAQERQAPEQVRTRRREPQFQEQQKQKKPVLRPLEAPVTQRQENKGKNGSRSERDSPVIKISSSILKENGASRGTSEHPSIEARLQGYRAQVRKPSASTKVRSKTKSQAKAR